MAANYENYLTRSSDVKEPKKCIFLLRTVCCDRGTCPYYCYTALSFCLDFICQHIMRGREGSSLEYMHMQDGAGESDSKGASFKGTQHNYSVVSSITLQQNILSSITRETWDVIIILITHLCMAFDANAPGSSAGPTAEIDVCIPLELTVL